MPLSMSSTVCKCLSNVLEDLAPLPPSPMGRGGKFPLLLRGKGGGEVRSSVVRRLSLFAVSLFIYCCVPLTAADSTLIAPFEFFQPITPPREFQTIAHRGMMQQAPENTCPAIELAIEDGIEWVEVDVRLTKDGKHVLFHDPQVDGKTNGRGKVKDLTLAELKGLDAGSMFAPRYAGEKILSLTECLGLAKGRINLYLDCKEIDPELLACEVLGAGLEKQSVVFTDPEVLRKVRVASVGRVPVMPKWRGEGNLKELLDSLHPAAVEVDADKVTVELCQQLHGQGVKVQVKVLGEWDKPEWWGKCMSAGADWFQTDLPEELIAYAFHRKHPKNPVAFSLHRGASRYAPENTLPAFEKAAQLGADFIEFDVHTTSDGGFFLLHDGKLDRTTNGKGPISACASSVVASLDAGAWFGKLFRGLKVPSLEEFLSTIPEGMSLYFDAKDIAPDALVKALEEHHLIERTVIYQTPDYLIQLKEIAPQLRRMPPLGSIEQIVPTAGKVQPYAFDVSWHALSKELIGQCHQAGIKVFSDALGKNERIEAYLQAMEWGIDLIQTDHPLRLIRAFEIR